MNRSLYLRKLRNLRDQVDMLLQEGAMGEASGQGGELVSSEVLASLKSKMDYLLGKNDDVIAQAEKFLSQPGNFGKKAPEVAKLFNESIDIFNEGIKKYNASAGADSLDQLRPKIREQREKVKDLGKRLFEKSQADIKSCAIYAFGIGIVFIIISLVICQVILKKNADASKTESMTKNMANKIISTKSISTFSSFIDDIRERLKASMNPLVLIPFFLGFLFASAGLLGMLHPEYLVDGVIEEADKQSADMEGVKGIKAKLYIIILKSLRPVYTMVLFPIANALS